MRVDFAGKKVHYIAKGLGSLSTVYHTFKILSRNKEGKIMEIERKAAYIVEYVETEEDEALLDLILGLLMYERHKKRNEPPPEDENAGE